MFVPHDPRDVVRRELEGIRNEIKRNEGITGSIAGWLGVGEEKEIQNCLSRLQEETASPLRYMQNKKTPT